MTREEHLKFCKVCINRKTDRDKGLICRLTNEIANFEEHCPNFEIDESVQIIQSKSDKQKELAIGWKIVSFFIPIAGAILYDRHRILSPKKAKQACYAALLGISSGILIKVLVTILEGL